MRNLDKNVVKDFGDEWKEYNQRSIENEELKNEGTFEELIELNENFRKNININ